MQQSRDKVYRGTVSKQMNQELIELYSQKSYLDILNIFKENKYPFDFTEYNREFGSHILDISKKTPIDQVRYIEDEYWFRIGQRPWDRLPLSGIAITIGYMYNPNYRYKKYILYDRIEIYKCNNTNSFKDWWKFEIYFGCCKSRNSI